MWHHNSVAPSAQEFRALHLNPFRWSARSSHLCDVINDVHQRKRDGGMLASELDWNAAKMAKKLPTESCLICSSCVLGWSSLTLVPFVYYSRGIKHQWKLNLINCVYVNALVLGHRVMQHLFRRHQSLHSLCSQSQNATVRFTDVSADIHPFHTLTHHQTLLQCAVELPQKTLLQC